MEKMNFMNFRKLKNKKKSMKNLRLRLLKRVDAMRSREKGKKFLLKNPSRRKRPKNHPKRL